jgi:hypothetical protein
VETNAQLAHPCRMRICPPLAILLLLAACGSPDRRSDGVTPSEAAALDNAAAKVDAARIPADQPPR